MPKIGVEGSVRSRIYMVFPRMSLIRRRLVELTKRENGSLKLDDCPTLFLPEEKIEPDTHPFSCVTSTPPPSSVSR